MAQLNVQLKCGEDNLYPKTKLAMVDGLIDEATGKIDTTLLPKTGIDIKYNNGMVQQGVTQINFAGTVTVEKTAEGVVKARIGQNQNSSNFNATDGVTTGTVSYSGITTKSMIMITPTDSSVWGIGDWAAGSSHSGFNKSGASQNITFTTQGNIHFDEAGSNFVVQLYKWDNTEVASGTFTVGTDGAVTGTATGMTCNIAGFGDETNVPAAVGKMGKPTFTVNIAALLPNGGRFYVKITHNNGTQGAFSYQMPDLFYNAGTAPVVAAPTVTLAQGAATTQLSGVTFYSGGTLNVASTSVANLNKLAAAATKVALSGSLINAYTYNASHLTGYTTEQASNPSFAATVTLANNKSNAGTAVSISMNATNAFATSGNVSGSAGNLLIDTLTAGTSNATAAETFKTEDYRLKSDLQDWDSTQSLINNDGLQQIHKTLKYPSVDYSGFLPAGPDYSGITGFRYYLRSFTFVGTKFGGTFTFGNLAQSDINEAKLSIEVSKDGTTWYDITRTKAQNPTNGIRVFADSVKLPKLQFAFDDAASDVIYLRIGMNNTFTKAITSLAFA